MDNEGFEKRFGHALKDSNNPKTLNYDMDNYRSFIDTKSKSASRLVGLNRGKIK